MTSNCSSTFVLTVTRSALVDVVGATAAGDAAVATVVVAGDDGDCALATVLLAPGGTGLGGGVSLGTTTNCQSTSRPRQPAIMMIDLRSMKSSELETRPRVAKRPSVLG